MPSVREKLAKRQSKLRINKGKIKDHPADLNNYQEGGFYNVDIGAIQENPYQPRQFFTEEGLEELTESIKQKGVLQPLIIRRDEAGKVYLVAGERRLRAAKQAGLESVPAILTKGNPIEISLIENLQREDLHPIEEAEALGRMMEEFGYTQEQLASVIGKGRTTITQTLSLNKLPEEIKTQCPHADIPKRVLVEIARKETPEQMVELFNRVKSGNLRGDQVRERVRKRTRKSGRTSAEKTVEATRRLSRLLAYLDLESIGQTERAGLFKELEDLKRILDLIFEK